MSDTITIAVDAMGGENSPEKAINGIEIFLSKNSNNFFLLYGNQKKINDILNKKPKIKTFCEIIDCPEVVLDNESPLAAAKKGKQSSMWSAINSLKDRKAQICLSAGNTGAMLIMSRLILKTLEGIEKPALAGLWPNKTEMNVVLDLGANIECSDKNLIDFCNMGSALIKSLYPQIIPRVALLNVGLEEIKGSENLKKTYNFLKEKKKLNYEFSGYIEGNQIMVGDSNVIVTDGFTGNIALKTAEGTANFITNNLKELFNKSILSKISLIFSGSALKKFKQKFDPRKYNGAIFLGLESPVVKSHGSTDSLGFAYSIEMCNKIIKGNLIKKIKDNLISVD